MEADIIPECLADSHVVSIVWTAATQPIGWK